MCATLQNPLSGRSIANRLARVLLWVLFAAVTANAQSTTGADGKPLAFEIVSIRPSADTRDPPQFGATPDGYHALHLSALVSILQAYLPTGAGETSYFTNDRIQGASDWLRTERYDIVAKVAEADLPEWRKPSEQPAMLHAMMLQMLTERFKLAVHRETKESAVYTLVIAKSGPKLKETDPETRHPSGITLPGGSVMVTDANGQTLNFYGATMSSLALVLSNFALRPVQDQTGLTGRYDFSLDRSSVTAMRAEQAGAPAGTEPGVSLFTLLQEQLGLKLVSGKSMVETLVLDHIERPTSN